MFNVIVVQEAGKHLLDEFDLKVEEYTSGYYVLDAVDVTTTLIHKAVRAGLQIFNLITMEDVVIKNERVAGLVINWSAVDTLKWHVDPLTLHAKYVIDGTGHPANVAEVLVRKMGIRLNTVTGGIVGENAWRPSRANYKRSRILVRSIPVFMSAAWLPMRSMAGIEWGLFSAVCFSRAKRPRKKSWRNYKFKSWPKNTSFINAARSLLGINRAA